MRDIILGRKEGSVNMRQARRGEKRMVEACERRILEFPLDMDEREFAEQLKREGGMIGRQIMMVLFSGSNVCGQKREAEERVAQFRQSSHQVLHFFWNPLQAGATLSNPFSEAGNTRQTYRRVLLFTWRGTTPPW
jgi:hypothetical protein